MVAAIRSFGKEVIKNNPKVNGFQKFLCVVDGHEKTDFLFKQYFWIRPFFDLLLKFDGSKNGRSQKSCYNKKSVFFMPVNHAKEFLKSIHNNVAIS